MMKKVVVFLLVGGISFAELIVEPGYVNIEGTFTVSGTRFGANEEVLIEALDKTEKVIATENGDFSCIFTVDLIPGGEYSITAQSQSKVEYAKIWVVPTVKISPNTGVSGDKIDVLGVGYGAGERIQIGLGRAYLVAEAYASSYGTFSASFIVGSHPKGENKLFAMGHSTYLLAEAEFFMKENISISPDNGFTGCGIRVSGAGFSPNDVVRIDFGKIETIGTTTVDVDGNFSMGFSCPKLSGVQLVKVKTEDRELTSVFTINPRLISVEPRIGHVRTKILINADGLIENEVLTVSFDDHLEYATFTISEDGVFSDGFFVDTRPGGIKVITIETSNSNIFHTQTFIIRPSILFITPTEPNPGTKITFEGAGFLAGESIRVDFGIREGIVFPTADDNGWFVAEYTIQDTPGNYRVAAIGRTTYDAGIRYVMVVEPEEEEPEEEGESEEEEPEEEGESEEEEQEE